MKKVILSLFIILAVFVGVNARAKYQGIAGKGGKAVKTSSVITYKLLETYPSCTVTIYLAGTLTIAIIYSDNSGTVKANPFTSSSIDASYAFYADNGKYDIKFSGSGISTPFTIGDIALSDPSDVYNAQNFGWIPDSTDRSAEALDMLATICPAGLGAGGTIYFPPAIKKYRADSQLFIPNDGASPQPHQCNLKFEGAGGGANWYSNHGNSVNSSILDLRYQASDGNAKIESRGLGAITFENLMFVDGGSVNNTPFMHFTNTVPTIRNNNFIGSLVFQNPMPIGTTRSAQDAIVLGGTGVIGGGVDAAYQGYCPRIENNNFSQLNRGIYLRRATNCASILNNSFIENTGSVAIESVGSGSGGAANYGMIVSGNSIEMNVYIYGIKLTNTTGGLFSNSFYDAGELTLAGQSTGFYNLTTSPGNTFIHLTAGEGTLTPPMFTGDSSSKNSVTSIGGLPRGDIFGANEKDVNNLGITTAEFGNNMVVRGEYVINHAAGYPGQLAIASLATPSKSLRLGYNNTASGDNSFIDSWDSAGAGRPLLINPTNLNSGELGGFVGIGNISYTNLSAPLHVGVDASGNSQRWGNSTNTNYLHLLVNGSLTRFNNSGTRPINFSINSSDLFSMTSTGRFGIGTTTPTSSLQVIGLPVYVNNAAAIAGGLTIGAFYRTGADPDPVMVVH